MGLTATVESHGVPGKTTLVQQRCGSVQRGAAADASGAPDRTERIHEAAQRGTAGSGSALPHLATIQRLFGRHDVSGVSAHVGGAAAEATAAMGAQAYATGDRVAFGSAPDLFTAAHEAAHVVQQRAGVQLKGGVGAVGDPYERHADAVAERVVRGESAEALLDTMAGGGGSAAGVQMIATYGGEWSTEYFNQYVEGNKRGANIKIVFEPKELVRSPKIGFTQTLKSMRGDPAAPYYLMVDEREARSNTAADGDEGRQVDRLEARTSPIYGRNNDASEASNTHFGHRNVARGGAVDADNAWMTDQPWLPWVHGRPQSQTFETAALSLEGVQVNTYYGTVSWTVNTDGDGNVSVVPLAVVSMGAPTAEFMASAGHWNDQQVDVDGTLTDTENLPLTSHRTADPASLNDEQLEARMRTLCDEILAMDRTTPDYQNKRFEIRGLAREAVRRATAAGHPVDSGHTLTAARGDSLWRLAERHLGGGPHWTRIFMLNYVELGDPNRIFAGATLKMPVPYHPSGS